MRYKVTNFLPPTEDDEELRIEVVFDTFEEVVTKVVRDLNSFWNKMIPQNYTFNIKEVQNDTPLGMKYFNDNKLMDENEKEIKEALDVIGSETIKHHRKINGFAGMDSKDPTKLYKDLMMAFGDSK